MEAAKVKIEAMVGVEREKAWEYYTVPEHIVKWNFASDDWHCPSASTDLHVGGVFSARMEAKDGSSGFDFEGIYDEIVEGEKVVYHMSDGRVVTVTFASKGEGTLATVVFDAEMINSVELQRRGWQAILNNFKKYAEGRM
jgi:uncharacterized protein YndB with AHSA1/START domain